MERAHAIFTEQRRGTDAVLAFKDDMVVVMARLDRIDTSTRAAVDRMKITTRGVLDELRAMHSRHDRVARRVERLEDANRDAPA